MLDVKNDCAGGCTFIGKGFVGHPEMGTVEECREVTFDEGDPFEMEWKNLEVKKRMYKTSTGYVLDKDQIRDHFEIELYADFSHLSTPRNIRWRS